MIMYKPVRNFYDTWIDRMYRYERGDFVRDLLRLHEQIKRDTIDDVISIAREEIDFESQDEQTRFVQFMEAMKKPIYPSVFTGLKE